MGIPLRRLCLARFHILTLCLIALSVASCGSNEDWFESAVAERYQGGGKTVRLGDLTKFRWDRICYYSPYMKSAALEIDNAEHEWVLLFYQGDKAVGRAEGRRSKLEIVLGRATAGNPPCFPPDRIAKLHGERGITHMTLTDAIK